jgi:ribosome biogenesis protein BRX1
MGTDIILTQTFAAPKTARRAKPFIDHVTSFSVTDGKIWFRNYQIVHDQPLDLSVSDEAAAAAAAAADKYKGSKPKNATSKLAEENMSMNEIGPRFVLVPVKIFEGSFGGAVVWENPGAFFPCAITRYELLLISLPITNRLHGSTS